MFSLVCLLRPYDGPPSWRFILFGIIFVLGQLIWGFYWLRKTTAAAAERLANWIQQNGWQQVELERQHSSGPFSKWGGKGVFHFRFIVANAQGQRHVGWAKFDHSPWGRGNMEIKWEEELSQPLTPVSH